ncbi:glycoside hydrolase family 16 protein [Myxococcota bacterium]|nr:glycoside hydrolase family 16 protein [Myxococcota bacterium]
MRTRATFFLLFLSACASESDAIVEPPIDWFLSWNDEFDGPAGALPDASRWTFDVGGSGWGNDQLEFDTDRPENVSVDGLGRLAITARREAYEGREYTSGRILTKGLFAQAYGRIEARILLPPGQGIWPAFWMLGADFEEVGWPECGEIDIMEFRGQDRGVVHGSLHGPGYFGGSPVTAAYRLPDDKNFDEAFHVFAVEWDPGRITWSVDDEVYQIVTTSDVLARGRWVFDGPFFILLNVAVGGSFVGPPNANTPFPASMVVDYVRVFERMP